MIMCICIKKKCLQLCVVHMPSCGITGVTCPVPVFLLSTVLLAKCCIPLVIVLAHTCSGLAVFGHGARVYFECSAHQGSLRVITQILAKVYFWLWSFYTSLNCSACQRLPPFALVLTHTCLG